MAKTNFFKNFKQDIPSGLVVFFVALPLCLGIALASGAPLFAGLISGILGGIVIGIISGSSIGVSGPAAGLAAVVLNAITSLDSFEIFLYAVFVAGIIQIIMGILKAGVLSYYVPVSVIRGMLAGIGIIIILKELPYFFGYTGEVSFFTGGVENVFSNIATMIGQISPGVLLISAIGMGIILLWDKVLKDKHQFFKILPGPLVAVVTGILFYYFIGTGDSALSISSKNIVDIPVPSDFKSFFGQFTMPDFSQWANVDLYVIAFTIAIVASLETLLSVQATDKLDPWKRTTPTNRELLVQGVGNTVSGLIGGLPLTQVIVRSTTNVVNGGKSKLATITHGILLISSVAFIPTLINLIPLGVLACVLIIIGYKLASPLIFRDMFKQGKSQFLPFIITVVGIVYTNLLYGIAAGMILAFIFVLRQGYRKSHILKAQKNGSDNGSSTNLIKLAEEVNFLNKYNIQNSLKKAPDNSTIIIDITKTKFMDNDVLTMIVEFIEQSKEKNVRVKVEVEVHEDASNKDKNHFSMRLKDAALA